MENVRISIWQSDQKEALDYSLVKPISLGRQTDNDIVIDSDTASRYHGQILVNHGHIELQNTSDKNPIHVNHKGLEKALAGGASTRLHQGDKFTLGGLTFEVRDVDVPAAAAGAGMLMLTCPLCGRSIPSAQRECPYDGYSLAGAVTTYINPELVDDTM